MIRVSKEIHCDRCAWWESIDIDVTRDWPYFKAQGWTRKNGEHYCADCSKVAHPEGTLVGYQTKIGEPFEFVYPVGDDT